MKHDNDAYVQR